MLPREAEPTLIEHHVPQRPLVDVLESDKHSSDRLARLRLPGERALELRRLEEPAFDKDLAQRSSRVRAALHGRVIGGNRDGVEQRAGEDVARTASTSARDARR